jgi:hypothetical protein
MKLLFSVAALLVLTVGSAMAQPPGKPLSNTLLERGGEDIDKDLGVSDDVARNLALLRDEYQAAVEKAYQDAGLNPRDFPNKMTPEQQNTFVRIKARLIDEYISKAAALLSPDQIKRVRQIEFQIHLNGFGLSALVLRDVALELKLTADQMQAINSLISEHQKAGPAIRDEAAKLRAGYLDAAIDLLTDEQRVILSELKGREFKSRSFGFAMTAGPALSQQKGGPFTPPDQLPEQLRSDNIVTLAAIEAVQKDLGVGNDVARKLTLLNNDYQAAMVKEREKAGLSRPGPGQFGKIGFSGKTTDEQREKIMEFRGRLNNEFIPKATELLSADQVKRIQQIQLQARLTFGPRALLAPAVASELKLTDDQKESLTALHTEMREKQFPGGAGIPAQTAREKLRKVVEEYAPKVVEVLTAEQKEVLKKLKGKEFDVSKLPPGIAQA